MAKQARQGMYGTSGVEKYFLSPYMLFLPVELPNDIIGGHCRDIFRATKIDMKPNIAPIIKLSGDGRCETAMHVKNEHKLKRPSSFCSRYGFVCGDSLLIRIKLQFVVVNAISIPADTKSSRYLNGTHVAKIVISTPAKRAPFRGLPVSSISANIGGSRPSFAEDNFTVMREKVYIVPFSSFNESKLT